MKIDETNKKPCNLKKKTHCALMTATLAEPKGAISSGFQLFSGKTFIAYKANKKAPQLIFNNCPFCGEKISA